MVTAELAVALPALTLVVATALTAIGAVIGQLRCGDAAAVAARLAARGESPVVVQAAFRAAAPAGASLRLSRAGDTVSATVRAGMGPLGFVDVLPYVHLAATSVAPEEP
jgi:hypothetical protein